MKKLDADIFNEELMGKVFSCMRDKDAIISSIKIAIVNGNNEVVYGSYSMALPAFDKSWSGFGDGKWYFPMQGSILRDASTYPEGCIIARPIKQGE